MLYDENICWDYKYVYLLFVCFVKFVFFWVLIIVFLICFVVFKELYNVLCIFLVLIKKFF